MVLWLHAEADQGLLVMATQSFVPSVGPDVKPELLYQTDVYVLQILFLKAVNTVLTFLGIAFAGSRFSTKIMSLQIL